jgi:hypothetical protein
MHNTTVLRPFDQIVERYYPAIFSIATELGCDPVAAGQFVRRVFKRMEKRFPKLPSAAQIEACLLLIRVP